ncbi:hypothetical protein CAPTEDRAFT_224761 [Capitella teleta]|uniref:LRRCT domain-containing protein n=1 Tax=Capitella teleta TaxID=283909 RepID=R7UVN0_CAPTE|nr:hypothetical protein CAPTEDRAFT_224761 [Capitella teleta]|eukprot:ELU10317.1 hypothetical protein CAPTEDRAFT_224761 [Capitella teleta]
MGFIGTTILVLLYAACNVVGSQEYDHRSEGLMEVPEDIPLNVTSIDLSGNSIEMIGTRAFCNFTELTRLSLSDNNINFIHHDAFFGLFKLRSLNLYNNSLDRVPNLQGLRLDSLLLYDNNIELKDGDFEDVSVKVLSIGNNEIRNVSPISELSESLQSLFAQFNLLGNTSAADLYNLFQSLTRLDLINLVSCGLKTFPDIRQMKENSGMKMYIKDNPWNCDCRLSWIKFTRISIDFPYNSVTCATPAEHEGILIKYVSTVNICPDVSECVGMSVQSTSGPVTGGTRITVTGPCVPSSLQVGQTTLYSTENPRVFVTKPVANESTLPIAVVLPTLNGTKTFILDQTFTYTGLPDIEDIQPRVLNVDGGTEITVHGKNFVFEGTQYMNLTQMQINVNTSDGPKTFDAHNYDLILKWGIFQHEAKVLVSNINSNITKLFDNKLQFRPPVEVQLVQKADCQPGSHYVEVKAGNTKRQVGCLTYGRSKVSLKIIILLVVFAVAVAIAVAIVVCCIIREKKKKDFEPPQVEVG